MSKRFTDTNKWRKGFVRSLQAPYKLLWLYILDECDHAGIWHVELDVACLRIGFDIEIEDALKTFEGRIIPFSNDEKWFIPDFISFQYGELNDQNRVHQSVIRQIKKYGLNKHLESPLQGVKDKDKEKDKDKAKEEEKNKAKKKRSYTLPDDWQPNDRHQQIALEGGVDIKDQLDRFRDYARSENWKKADWDATFRNWIRRSKDFGRTKQASNPKWDGLTAAQRKMQMQDEVLRRSGRGDND